MSNENLVTFHSNDPAKSERESSGQCVKVWILESKKSKILGQILEPLKPHAPHLCL